MSTTPDTAIAAAAARSHSDSTSRKRRRWVWFVAGGAVLVLGTLGMGSTGWMPNWFSEGDDDALLYTIEPVDLNVTLREDGELRPVHSVDLKCEVQGHGITIRWLVEESTPVKKDDLLVELASDELRNAVRAAEIELDSTRSALEEAKAALEITQSENASAMKKAQIDLEIAELELEKYKEGDFEKAKKSIEISISQTDSELKRVEDELRRSRPLQARGFIAESQIEELENTRDRLVMTLEKHNLEMQILLSYDFVKNEKQKKSTIDRAKDELKQEQIRAATRERQAIARVRKQENILANREESYNDLKTQLEKCEIRAPIDGIVRYGGADRRRRWGRNEIAVGEQVFQGQTLITIPDTSQMMVTTRIHEADRHKVEEGMPCVVKVPAVPGQTFSGKLSKIAQFADSERSWWNPELKEHATEILLDETDAPLSPGDSAEIEILIREVPDVLAVPVQCVYSRGANHYVFVRGPVSTEPRQVKLGWANTTMVEVAMGLEAGDRVLMAPDDRHLAMLPTPGTEETDVGREFQRIKEAEG